MYTSGKVKEAETLQLKLAQMEWGFAQGGINGTKWVVAKLRGYPMESCECRRPYPKYDNKTKQLWIKQVVEQLAAVEETMGSRRAHRVDCETSCTA